MKASTMVSIGAGAFTIGSIIVGAAFYVAALAGEVNTNTKGRLEQEIRFLSDLKTSFELKYPEPRDLLIQQRINEYQERIEGYQTQLAAEREND